MRSDYGIQGINEISRFCYYVGLGIGFLGLASVFAVLALHIPLEEVMPKCIFFAITGYYCPGCGGTRAAMALLHGRVIESLYYHPFVMYAAAGYLAYEISHTMDIVTHGKIRGLRFCPCYFYVGIALIIAQWLIKNYLRLRFGFLL